MFDRYAVEIEGRDGKEARCTECHDVCVHLLNARSIVGASAGEVAYHLLQGLHLQLARHGLSKEQQIQMLCAITG